MQYGPTNVLLKEDTVWSRRKDAASTVEGVVEQFYSPIGQSLYIYNVDL